VKDVIVIFNSTLKGNGYSVNRLTDVLLQVGWPLPPGLASRQWPTRSVGRLGGFGVGAPPQPQVRTRYQDVLVMASGEAFRSILAEDNYTPLNIANEAEYREVGRIFPLEEPGQELAFPRTLPFR
jgi:hypothetical protein